MAEAARHRSAGDAKSAFAALERAHVLGQLDFVPHLCGCTGRCFGSAGQRATGAK
jgi:hypothetical protein